MSGTGFGSPDHPYVEMPLAGYSAEVHWAKGVASWPTMPFSYLERLVQPSPAMADSYTGTAAFWLRVNGTMAGENPGSPSLGTTDGIPIVFVIGPRHLAGEGGRGGHDQGFYIRVRGNADFFQVQVTLDRIIGNIRVLIEPVDTVFGTTRSLPGNLCDEKWAHFLMNWDFSTGAGAGKLIVNKVERTIYPQSNSYDFVAPVLDIKTPSEIPARVPWGQPARFFGAHTVLGEEGVPPQLVPAAPMNENYKLSLAHVWISAQHKLDDVSKFVTEDNTPAKLGSNGEVVTVDVNGVVTGEFKPDFYFRGGPGEFVKNLGLGGEVKLVGDLPPTSQSISPKIGT